MGRIWKVLAASFGACLLASALAACGSGAAPTQDAGTSAAAEPAASSTETSAGVAAADAQTITDLAGDTVEVPTQIDKIADLWHAHNQIVIMLGAGDKLVGTTENFKGRAWANVIYPNLANVEALVIGSGAGEVNYEEALSLEPDVVFASDPDVTAQARQNGLTAVNVAFTDYDGLRNDVNLTAEILGPEAQAIADEWTALLDKNIALVADRMADVSDTDRPRVLHIVNASSFTMVDGTNTIVDEWIKLAGGVNAIETEGNRVELTMEEIIAADPDIIIIGSATPEDVEALKADEAFASMPAVQNGAVYANPDGVFPWDRYSGEEALQVLWAAQKLNPDRFADIDMVAETKNFYKTFYDFDLTDDQAERILAGESPE